MISSTVRAAGSAVALIPGFVRSAATVVSVFGASCAGAGVGGGVHDGDEVFELVGGGEDFQVVQAAAGAADERALAVAEFLFAGFGAVLVDRVGPVFGDAGEEIGVVLGGGAGQGVFHLGGPGRGGEVPYPVEGKGNDGARFRADLCGPD